MRSTSSAHSTASFLDGLGSSDWLFAPVASQHPAAHPETPHDAQPLVIEEEEDEAPLVLESEDCPPDEMIGTASSSRSRGGLEDIAAKSQKFQPRQAVERLTIPFLVKQILKDCETHWQALVEQLVVISHTDNVRTLLLAGCLHREGYTTVTLALALAIVQQTGKRVALVDADFSHPSLAQRLGVTPRHGIEDVVLDGIAIEEAMVVGYEPPLSLLSMVNGFEQPALVIKNDRFASVIKALRAHYDFVLIDGGQLLAEGSYCTHLSGVDASLLVHDPSRSSARLLDQAERLLEARGIPCLGVIENLVE